MSKTLTLRLPMSARAKIDAVARTLQVSPSIAARRLCGGALASEPVASVRAHIPEPRAPGYNCVVTLSDPDHALLVRWRDAVESGASDGHFLSGLCLLQLERGIPEAALDAPVRATASVRIADDSLIARINDALGQPQRPPQSELFAGIQRHLAEPGAGVLFAEASTGVGKTRAAIAATIDRVKGHPERVAWVTSPTIAILKQWHAELRAIQGACAGADEAAAPPAWRMILGRGEFVSEAGCRELAEALPDRAEEILAWLDAGALHPDSPRELPGFLRESLGAILGDEDVPPEVRLTADTPPDDPGAQSYSAQFVPGSAQIVLLTHAMLATEIRSRLIAASRGFRASGGSLNATRSAAFAERRAARHGDPKGALGPLRLGELMAEALAEHDDGEGRLPDCDHMVVDEAHLLEQSIANALAHSFSLSALLKHARRLKSEAPGVRQAALNELADAHESIAAAAAVSSRRDGAPMTVPVHGGSVESSVRRFHLALKQVLDFRRAKSFRSPNLSALQLASRALAMVFPESRMGNRAYLRGSPVLRRPQIVCGRGEIDLEMAWLWMQMAPKSVLISATLSTGGPDPYRVSQRQLHVPPEVVRTLEPIVPPWLTDPVTLWLPAPGRRPSGGVRFIPPSSASRELGDASSEVWFSEIASHISGAMRSAAGGAIVLANSYTDLDALSIALSHLSPITVVRGTRVADYEREFYGRCLSGEKALLLATGQAWTGIDVGGHQLAARGFAAVPAEEDNILTDLFVLRLPFGLNASVTHLARIERFGLGVEFQAAAQLLKQGLGRLVRRAGLPENRRIHVLDGRFNEDLSVNAVRACRVILSAYNKRQSF